MRDLINLMEMSMAEAERVFTLLGVDVQNIDDEALKKEYRNLLMKHHPDKGGNVETAQMITSAYDVLKGKPRIAQGGYRAFYRGFRAPTGAPSLLDGPTRLQKRRLCEILLRSIDRRNPTPNVVRYEF